ncbi:uncharacterized protein EKO05_0005838 [Ascochyta rabiei]|uniref:uncharacterized protein n=1 Tax=Didymella rabiei TaxID=5454 RepID=UPI0019016E53|nr:uncharacterized protein EKO05_0005838 [Ascochyta rabiei]UPX15391.1 hypothetical protein EKO05_0005838 [Ascochyta rabiei]
MTLPEGLRYYILRDNVAVPLAPIDQLPFQLQDLPRQLTPCQASDAGWKLVGKTQVRSSMLAIQAPAAFFSQPVPPTKTTYLAPDHEVRENPLFSAQELWPLRKVPSKSVVHPKQTSLPPTNLSSPARTAFVTDVIEPVCSRNTQRPNHCTLTPSHTQPASRMKEYCDFWMRTGECNYADFTKSREGKGCIYKHEMPSDRNKLRELGFPHGVPRWYKEKTAIAAAGGLNWSRGTVQDSHDRKLSEEPRASRAFSPPKFINIRNEEMSKSMTVDPQKAPVEVGDLISFDDSPAATTASSPQALTSSCSGSTSDDTEVLVFPPSKLLLQTMASTFREHVMQIPDKASEDMSGNQPVSDSSLASDNKSHAKLFTSHPKHRSRQRKPVEHPANSGSQNGLARSKHATSSNSKKAENLSKGGKRRGNGIDPQTTITQRQSALHEKDKQ